MSRRQFGLAKWRICLIPAIYWLLTGRANKLLIRTTSNAKWIHFLVETQNGNILHCTRTKPGLFPQTRYEIFPPKLLRQKRYIIINLS